ncbi:unnamed protein product [Periconia digitata]|uniref:Uncharacterized protein n=1 Tax=Periconia digitata TaxID=1303443 RepID=A0A9W4XST3_9PLEO|nr:unnamed protein product [Periconia digitata]
MLSEGGNQPTYPIESCKSLVARQRRTRQHKGKEGLTPSRTETTHARRTSIQHDLSHTHTHAQQMHACFAFAFIKPRSRTVLSLSLSLSFF